MNEIKNNNNETEKKIDRELYLQIEDIRHNMFYDLKQLVIIKFKMAVILTSIICFTIMFVALVFATYWGW